MTIVNVKPVQGSGLFKDFDNLFNEFFKNDLPGLPRNGRNALMSRPAVNVIEKEDRFELVLAAPGLTKKDFNVTTEEDVLLFAADKEMPAAEGETIKRREFNFGRFERRFRLPKTVNVEEIDATYENGILRLTLPKRKEVLARKIEIS